MEEEPHPKRLQLHQPSQSATQEDAVAHMKAAEETLSDEKSRMVDNAISYLKAVKETFKDDQEKYIGFLQVMKDFKLSGVVTDEMMNRLKGMFEGHSSLLVGLNSFLPRGYEITDTSIACPPRKMELDDRAVIYIQKIKARFQNDDKTIYKSFQKMLKMFWQGDISQHDLHQQVQLLFCNHEDLLEDFRRFLPKPMDSDLVPPLQDSAKPSSGYISGLKSVRHSYKENMAKRQKTIDINSNHHDIFQSPLREDVERTSVDIENGNLKNGHKEKHLNKISKLKLKDRGETRAAQNRETELDAIYHCPYSRTLTSRSDVLIPEKRLMGQVYGSHEENSPQDPPMDCSKTLINVSRQKIDFCKKVKGKIVNTQLEKDNMTSTEQDYGKDRHRDNDRSCRSRDKLNNNALPISSNDEDISPQGRDFCKKVKRKLSNTKLEKENEQNTEQHHGKDRHGDNDQSCRSTDKLNNNASTMLSKGKGTDKPISEFCLSDSEHCTPSYCLLPQNYLKPVASYCTDLAAEVLNDCCVTMTSGSEDNSFKHMQKNYYEEILFRCEDDRYELDMLIESTAATITRINELLKKLQDSTIKRDDHIQIEEHLTALNLRRIEQLYHDHGLEVIDLLHENPGRALPVIQKRLQQKKDELFNCRSEYNKVWTDVFAKHYRKSLDHRSFYFKQQDKESLSTKGTSLKFSRSSNGLDDCVVFSTEKDLQVAQASYSSELSLQLMDIDAKVLEPAFTDYLHTDLLPTVLDMKRRQQVFLLRNMCKYTSVDEHCCLSKRMKGVTVVNGLHRVISCWRSKASYARSTEDFMIWKKPKKQRISAEPSQSSSITSSCYHDNRVLQFHELSSGKASLSQGSKTSHGYCRFNATSNSKLN